MRALLLCKSLLPLDVTFSFRLSDSSSSHLPGDTARKSQARGDRVLGDFPHPGDHHHHVPLRLLPNGGGVLLPLQHCGKNII